MTKIDEALVAELLRERGVEGLQPIYFVGARLGCTVWEGGVQAHYGDAPFLVLVYPLFESPESYVDLEEEIESLSAKSSERHLARELRDDNWVILITCAKKDAPIVDRFLGRETRTESAVVYHPQLDRIMGGDYFHQTQGGWLKACIAPMDRAMQLKGLLEAAEDVYGQSNTWKSKLERPLPRLLAVLTIPDLTVDKAPPAYDELVLMQFIVEGKDVIENTGFANQEVVTTFTRQLFGFLATHHAAGICFSRDAGCCLRPEFLLASGALTDVYFINCPAEENALARAKERDLWNALLVALDGADKNVEDIIRVLKSAADQYGSRNVPLENLDYLLSSVARGIVQNDTTGLKAFLKTMTSALD